MAKGFFIKTNPVNDMHQVNFLRAYVLLHRPEQEQNFSGMFQK